MPSGKQGGSAEDQTVHLVEDDVDLREALGCLLESVSRRHRSYGCPEEFLKSLPLAGGGCLVFDVRLPGMSGIDLVKEVRRREIPLPIIVMTAHADVPVTIQAFKQGATEFLLKPFAPAEFLDAIQSALETDRGRQAAEQAAGSLRSRLEELTKKDWEVIGLLRQGHPNKRIAAKIGISERAVEMRRQSLLRKTQTSTLAELIELVTRGELHRAEEPTRRR